MQKSRKISSLLPVSGAWLSSRFWATVARATELGAMKQTVKSVCKVHVV